MEYYYLKDGDHIRYDDEYLDDDSKWKKAYVQFKGCIYSEKYMKKIRRQS